MALWGTGYEHGRTFIEVEHRGKMIQRYWTKPDETQHQIQQAVTEEMRGGFTVHVTQVRENRAYLASRRVEVPWSNKELDIKWEHFVSKLHPDQKETWTAVVSTPRRGELRESLKSAPRETRPSDGEKEVAQMVATLYDQSLDAYQELHWLHRFDIFRRDYSQWRADFGNVARTLQHLQGQWPREYRDVTLTYRHFPPDLVGGIWTRGFGLPGVRRLSTARGLDVNGMVPPAATPVAALSMAPMEKTADRNEMLFAQTGARPTEQPSAGAALESQHGAPSVDLSQVSARKNLNETAFFFPQLTSDSNGVVRMTFTMPEALTTWKFLGFAYDSKCVPGSSKTMR